jgi:polysaccharide export outer membrane protein
MRKILNGKTPDVLLQPDDILFIPSSTMQKVTVRTMEAVIQTATGLAIWR